MLIVDSSQLERARLELRAMVKSFLFNPEFAINLIDFGFPQVTDPATGLRVWDAEQVALRFHVARKYTLEELAHMAKKVLPRQVGPFRTDVIEAEYQPAQLGAAAPASATRERLCGGLGISSLRDRTGTLGGIVRDRASGKPMILSNWHVLYVTRGAREGRPVYYPALRSAGPQPPIVARVARERLSAHDPAELPLDVAVATLADGVPWENLQLGIGRVRGVARARLGMQVVKAGLTTGKTFGAVSGVEGFSKMAYDGSWVRLIERVVTISRSPLNLGQGQVSRPGDSGAWWLDAATSEVVALHYAGLPTGTRAQAMDMQYVFDELGVELADETA